MSALTIIQSVCRECQKVYPLVAGVSCPECHSPLYMITFVATEQLARYEAVIEAARKFKVRAWHSSLCPKRKDFTDNCECGYDQFDDAIAEAEGTK